jgi:hypothetical protein
VITDTVIHCLLGEKEEALEQKGATIDIDGCYANLWSSFTTAEKLLQYFVPGKIIDVSGSLSKGYTIDGEKIVHIGNNAYDTPMGIVKFFVKDSEIMLATDYSQTYIKMNGLANKGVTLFIVLSFIISTLSYTVISLVSRMKRKTTYIVPLLMSIVQLLSLVGLKEALLIGISQYAILAYTFYVHIASWVIVAAMVAKLIDSFVVRKEQETKLLKFTSITNSIVSIAFCFVLLNLNLLF